MDLLPPPLTPTYGANRADSNCGKREKPRAFGCGVRESLAISQISILFQLTFKKFVAPYLRKTPPALWMLLHKFSSQKKDFTAAILTFAASISLPVPLSLLHGILQFNTHSFTLRTIVHSTGTFLGGSQLNATFFTFQTFDKIVVLYLYTTLYSHFTCDMYSLLSSLYSTDTEKYDS